MRRLTSEEFREVIGHFASGVTVVTALQDGQAYGTTASAFTSLSLDPPMVLVCLNRTSRTGNAIKESGRFAVNILADHQQEEAMRFMDKGDAKFEGIETTPGLWGEPLLPGSLATLECVVTEETSGGTHLVFIAEVEQGSTSEGAPLAYFRGEYWGLQ
jgi:flavin reductase (DIM6/NTAB) family NADH-FMN oxidoreductase RutF